MRKIDYSDKTLKNSRIGLSFREKVETARYLDRLENEAIELPVIENQQVDSLLVKSIAAALSNAVLTIDVGWTEEGIDIAWAAIENALKKRLQVVVPVSVVQMEYKVHKKPPVVLTLIDTLVKKCKTLCDDVEDAFAEAGIPMKKKEGQNEGRWAILDYGQLLVHVFHPEERQYYRLERLWDEGTNRLELPFIHDDEEKPFLP